MVIVINQFMFGLAHFERIFANQMYWLLQVQNIPNPDHQLMKGQGQKHSIDDKRDRKTVFASSNCFQHVSDQIKLPDKSH